RPQVHAVLPVAGDVVEAGIGGGRHRQDLALHLRLRVGGRGGAAAAGDDDGVDVPVVGPEAVGLGGDAGGELAEGVLGQAGEVVLLAFDLDGAAGHRLVQAVQFDLGAALLVQQVGDGVVGHRHAGIGRQAAALGITGLVAHGE